MTKGVNVLFAYDMGGWLDFNGETVCKALPKADKDNVGIAGLVE